MSHSLAVGLASAPRVSSLLGATREHAKAFGVAHSTRVAVVALVGASLPSGVAGAVNLFTARRATAKRAELSDVRASVNRLNAAMAHVRVELALTDDSLVVLSLAGATASDAELFASLWAVRQFNNAQADAADSSSSDRSPIVDVDQWLEAREREVTRATLYLFLIAHVVAVCHDGPALDVTAFRHLRSVLELKRSLAADLDAFLSAHEADFGAAAPPPSPNRSADLKALVQQLMMPGHVVPVLCAIFPVAADDLEQPAHARTLRAALAAQLHAAVRAHGLDSAPVRLAQLGSNSALLVHCDSTFAAPIGADGVDPLCAEALLSSDTALSPPALWEGDALTGRLIRGMLAEVLEKRHALPAAKAKPGDNSEPRVPLPTCRAWFSAAVLLQEFCFADERGGSGDVGPERAVSQQLCKEATSAALQVYNAALAPVYAASVHDERLRAALATYARLAAGSCSRAFEQALRSECARIWAAGRQRCEAQSLLGLLCELPRAHDGAHRSGARLLLACSCGATQRERADAFSSADAVAFYAQFECCKARRALPLRSDAWSALVVAEGVVVERAMRVQQPGFVADRAALDDDLFAPIAALPTQLDGAPFDAPADAPVARLADLASLVAQAHEKSRLVPSDDAAARQRLDQTLRQLSSVIERRCVHGGVGFEYECGAGHRFFEPVDSSSALRACVSASSARERPLTLACVRCDKTAQLQRIHVATSSKAAPSVLRVRIATADADDDEALDSGSDVQLPRGALVVVRLPVRTASESATARLLPNSIRLQA